MSRDITGQDVSHFAAFPPKQQAYAIELLRRVQAAYDVAAVARRCGYDPTVVVESRQVFDLADRVEQLLGLPLGERLREILQSQRTEAAALQIAEEVALGRFGFLATEDALDRGVRVGLAVVTDGVTVAPLQGVSSVRVKRNDDGTSYVAVAFAGPIRSAGGTEAAFTIVIADRLRRVLGLDKYRVNGWGEDEVGRWVEELRVYERDVGSFQFRVSDADLRYTVEHLPVEVDGVETDPVEVVVHRGLRRILTDRVRGGALRVVNDGVIGRARKLLRLITELEIPGWEWLETLGVQRQTEERSNGTHFQEVISGRPVLSMPNHPGGFRLRYGRTWNSGLSTVAVHPAVSALLDYPIVAGTQVKIELPGKAATIAYCDSLEGPVVRLRDGSVRRVDTLDEALTIRGDVEKVLHLGDLLVAFGDFLENNVALEPAGYAEEWWAQEVTPTLLAGAERATALAAELGIHQEQLQSWITAPTHATPSAREAVRLSELLQVPLHPRHLFFWDAVTPSDIFALRSSLRVVQSGLVHCIVEATPTVKGVLDQLGVPHRVEPESLWITGDAAFMLLRLLRLDRDDVSIPAWTDTVDLLSRLSGITIRPKGGTYLGVRMGRPEKAMPRQMKPPVHLLFPVGTAGGASRDLLEAAKAGSIDVEVIHLVCASCGSDSTTMRCRGCGGDAHPTRRCPRCGRAVEGDCSACGVPGVAYARRSLPLHQLLQAAYARTGAAPVAPLKGVQGLSNAAKWCEPLEKGVLRRKHRVSIYKDGTVRFDATNAPLTHFRPSDLSVSTAQLQALGYREDLDDAPLTHADQLVPLQLQDVILPEAAGDHFVHVAQFVDDLLVKLYGLPPFYNVQSRDGLLGHLVVGLAPHTSVGIVGRIIGFTRASVCYAHPFWHSAKRRDCDGDEDALMLLGDMLINFSRDYLPAQIGGLMDAPLLLQPLVLPHEVQRQAHNIDCATTYPLAFYPATWQRKMPNEVAVPTVRQRLQVGTAFTPLPFTHTTTRLVVGRTRGIYAELRTLDDKLGRQIELARKIAAVDPHVVVASVLRTHLLPDVLGNMRAYTGQTVRCKKCGATLRRVPLTGKCDCGGGLQATVARASVEKYLAVGLDLARRFEVGEYLRARWQLAADELEQLFPNRRAPNQAVLTEFLNESAETRSEKP